MPVETLPPPYSRSRRGRALNVILDREAAEFVRAHAPGPGALGRYLSQLVFAERARQEERQRLATLTEGLRAELTRAGLDEAPRCP